MRLDNDLYSDLSMMPDEKKSDNPIINHKLLFFIHVTTCAKYFGNIQGEGGGGGGALD